MNTLPVGLCGELRTIARVRGVTARAQLVRVERPVGRSERDVAGRRAGEDRVGPVVLVERLEDDDLVARVEDREHRGDHPLGRAAGDRDLGLRVGLPARVGPGGLRRDRVAQRLRTPRDRVLVDVGEDGVGGSLLELVGCGEVGEALREADRAVRDRKAVHLADDRLGESLSLVAEPRRAGSHHAAESTCLRSAQVYDDARTRRAVQCGRLLRWWSRCRSRPSRRALPGQPRRGPRPKPGSPLPCRPAA